MSLSRLAVRRPVAVSMFFLAVILLGLISFARLPIDLLPDVSYPRLVIYTTYSDVGPSEIERLITERVEAVVAATPGVERTSSVSREGVSLVTLRFGWGTDMDFAMLNVRERLDNVRGSLPDQASRPQILRVDPESEPIMVLSVAGSDLWETKELAENVFRRRLEQLDGVAQAQVTGGLDREIVVEVVPERLQAYGLSMQDVANALDAANFQSSGGTIREGRARFPLRTLGEFTHVDQIRDVVVSGGQTGGAGGRVHVRDIGVVHDGFAERDALARYNGQEAVGLLVFKESGANTVRVAEMVEEVLTLLQDEFPEVALDVATSQAGFISDSIDNVVSALIMGGVLAFLVLFFFLREPRYPVAVALAIPISVVGTFALMDAFGVSLNIMSLGGLALGVGMLVDNSIIVLENIFRHREGGADAVEGSAEGAREVAGAITAATLTTIAVFLPIIYVEGVAGELFRDLSLSVAFSLLASLLVALTLLPTMAARFRIGEPPTETTGPGRITPGPRPKGIFRTAGWILRTLWRFPFWVLRLVKGVVIELLRFWAGTVGKGMSTLFGPLLRGFDRGFDAFAAQYHRALDWSLDHRAGVLGMAALALGLTALAGFTLDRDLLPRVDQGSFEVGLELSEGTALDHTDEIAQAMERILLDHPDVDAVFGTVGRDPRQFTQSDDGTGLHTARFQVRLASGASTAPVVDDVREALALAGREGVVTILTGQATALGQILGGSDADIAVRVRSQDLSQAFGYADQVVGLLRDVDLLENVRVGADRGQPQYEVEVRREDAARFGITANAVANAVEQGMRGVRATEFVEFDRRIPVMVRIPDELRFNVSTLQALQVQGIPLRELIDVELVMGPSEIRRENQGRVVTVLADVRGGGLDGAIDEVDRALAGLPLSGDLRVEVGGENEEMARSFRDLAFAFGLALILVFMILAAQFESFFHPGTILAAVPLALVGAILALLVTGQGLNTMSLIGIVILVGIVVNDSIVKVDFIVQARERGVDLRNAILEAGRVRLRPIIMTTVTTVLGLTPMALGIGRGADLRAPLAIAVIGGLLLATLLTLIIVPVLFSVVESARVALLGEEGALRRALRTSPIPGDGAGGGTVGPVTPQPGSPK